MDIGSLLKGFSRPPNVEHPTISVLGNDLVDGIAPASIDLASADDCVAFSSTEWLRVWYVRDWPRTLGYKNWLDVLRFPADLRASLFMEPYAPGVVIKELERQEVAIQAGRYVRFQQKRDPSPSEDQKLREIREERQLIEINGDPFYYLTLALGLFASSREQLEQLSAEVESQCRNAGLVIDRGKWQQEFGMLALLPHNMNTLGGHRRSARLDALTNMFPFTGDEIVMPDGLYYGLDMNTNMSVVLDPFRLENPSCILIGTSGGGKSFWMKDTIEQYVLDGARVFVLDIEDEYRHLCNDLGGIYLDMGIHSQHKINVLDFDPNDSEGLTGAFQDFLGWFYTAIGRGLVAQETEMLDKAYFNAFAANKINRDDRTTWHNNPPTLTQLYDALIALTKTEFHGNYAHALASTLYPMVGHGDGSAFDCATNVDVRSNPLVVFGLNSVKPAMMARRIRQIQQFTWQQMTQTDRAIEIVDEAWWLLQNPETAQDLAERARRFRKKMPPCLSPPNTSKTLPPIATPMQS